MCPVNTLAGYKFWRPRQVDWTIWNLDLKYFTNKLSILYTHWSNQTRVPVNNLAGYKFISWQLPSQWTSPSETLTWNTSPMKMLFWTLIQLIRYNDKHIQTLENLCRTNYSYWIQVFILTTLRKWTRPSKISLWNTSPIPMRLIFCTRIGVILWNPKHIQTHKNLCHRDNAIWIHVYMLATPRDGPSHHICNTSPIKMLFWTLIGWLFGTINAYKLVKTVFECERK